MHVLFADTIAAANIKWEQVLVSSETPEYLYQKSIMKYLTKS